MLPSNLFPVPTVPLRQDKRTPSLFFTASLTLFFSAMLWLVWFTTWALEVDLFCYGILPRHLHGLWGILLSPFLHADVWHLASNTVPFAVLFFVLINAYDGLAVIVLISIHLLTGFLVWLFAPSYTSHIGISGIIYGLTAFLIGSGIFRKDTVSVAIAIFVVLLYGGMFEGFLPVPGISWQSHLFGAIVGLLLSFFLRKKHVGALLAPEEMEVEERHFFDTES